MAKPDIIVINGHGYSWQQAWKVAQPRQAALFELKDDHRHAAERTAAGRYQEPTLAGLITEEKT